MSSWVNCSLGLIQKITTKVPSSKANEWPLFLNQNVTMGQPIRQALLGKEACVNGAHLSAVEPVRH